MAIDVAELTKNIAALAASPPTDLSEEARSALYEASGQLREAIMNPWEASLRFGFGIHETAAMRLGINLKLFDIIVAAGGPISVGDIANKAGADPLLVGRIMRMLKAMSLFSQPDIDTYAAKPLASVYTTGSPAREIIIHLGSQVSAIAQLPEYLAQNGYKNPDDAFDGPWQFGNKTSKHYFDWLADDPVLHNAFNTVMAVARLGQDNWFDFYPVEEKLKVASPDELLVVDIGAGMGHEEVAFLERFPSLQGKLVLLDLPSVVEAAVAKGLPSGIQAIAHNFFEPYSDSLRGAKAYYLRTVLHDWPDKQAKVIIQNIRDVMTKESVLLINEVVLPEKDITLYQAEMDQLMMVCYSSLERTESMYKELLEGEGLKLTAVYKPEPMIARAGTVMEFMLAE